MTREQAKELLPIITAFAEGKEIQVRSGGGAWVLAPDPNFSANHVEWRVKPEPREFELAVKRGDPEMVYSRGLESLRGDAKWEIIRVREVIEP